MGARLLRELTPSAVRQIVNAGGYMHMPVAYIHTYSLIH